MAPAERGPTAKTATLSMLHHGVEDGDDVGEAQMRDLIIGLAGLAGMLIGAFIIWKNRGDE